jgi:UDP-glucuronate 4-epimerase
MRVLVTGGAGFIGSHVAERLIREGHEVAIVDELNDYYLPELKVANLREIRQAGPFRFYKADICDESDMGRVFSTVRPEAVIHLAARAGVRPSLEQPLLYETVNVRGTLVLLEQCRLYGVPKFLFASSSSVYGNEDQVPYSEDHSRNLPISPYAATKLAGEKLCFTYSHLYGLSTTCLRFFTVYGPRQRPDLAIRKFTEAIDRGQSIPVFGDGTTSRDYTFVDDTVSGIVAALYHETAFEVFNLGNSSPVGLLDLIHHIERAVGKEAIIRWLPEQPGDVRTTYADITKARDLLGYNPVTTMPDGLRTFVGWHRNRRISDGIPALPIFPGYMPAPIKSEGARNTQRGS